MLLSMLNYAASDGYVVFMTLFLTEEHIVRMCCGLATLGESLVQN